MDSADVFDIGTREFSRRFGMLDFPAWCVTHILLVVNGRLAPFSFEGHEYLKEIYDLPDVPRLSFRKAAQMCVSTYALTKSFNRMDRNAIKVVYYFPTDDDVKDFSQDRANPMIDNSEYLSSKMRYERADNLGLKQMGHSSIYFRGVWTKRKVKAVDADQVVKDELDEADQENMIFAEDRLLHSAFRWIIELSQPSVPDYGIDLSFKAGDQRYWMVKCPKCGRWNNIVESFPKNLKTRGKGDNLTAYIGCTRCGAKLDTTKGTYVAKHPARSKDHISVQVSQLQSSIIPITELFKTYRGCVLSSQKKNFMISRIGLPYRDSELCPFTESLITAAEGGDGFEKKAYSSFIGIDVGDVCHVVVLGWTGYRLRLIHLAEVLSDNEQGFCDVIERFQGFFVIDAMPYKSLAKKLAMKYRGWGVIQYFKGDALKEKTEGEGEYEVPVVMHDRTESIDEMAGMFGENFIVLPNPRKLSPPDLELYERFKAQVKNLEKEIIEDSAGYKKAVYKKTVANHFGMALNSAFIAFRIGKGYFTPQVDPVFG